MFISTLDNNIKKNKNVACYISTSETDTQLIAKSLITNWLKSSNHILFLLEGNLGTGKTQFVKGIAKSLNFDPQNVHSPTFVFITDLVKKNLVLYHIDFYRIEEKYLTNIFMDHIEEIQNYTKQKTISCIEWANKINPKILVQLAKENKDLVFIKVKIEFFKKTFRKILVKKL